MDIRKGFALVVISLLSALPGCRDFDSRDHEGGMSSSSTGASGEVVVTKMGGGIDVESAPHGATLSTMGGGIHVGRVASFVKAKTMGGGVVIDHAEGSVDATTMGGGIRIGSVEGPVKAETMGGGISVREVGTSNQERDIQLVSKGGTVEVTVPKDFPMTVKIRLAHTRNADREYHIIQHAGLDVHESGEWDRSEGTARRYIRASGIVGTGLNHLTIEAVNGDVILNQE